jgi:hypothetical protein
MTRGLPSLPGSASAKAGVKTCDSCKGRGIADCPDCKRGRGDCSSCEKGRVPDVCSHCLQQRTVACDECLSGGYSRWETLGSHLLRQGQSERAASFFRRALEQARAMRGPVRLAAEHVELLAKLERLETLRRSLVALTGSEDPAPPAIVQAAVEAFWPLETQQRHWPNPPARRPLNPWADEGWMAGNRQRTVARLEAQLARALAAAGR